MLLGTGESVNIDAQDWNGLFENYLRYIRNPDFCVYCGGKFSFQSVKGCFTACLFV